MTDYQPIFESAKKFANQFRGFMQAAEALEQLQSINGAFSEAKQRLEKAKADFAAVKADIAKATADGEVAIASARAAAQSIRQDADQAAMARRVEADAYHATKKGEGDKAVAAALAHADDVKAKAKAAADKLIDDTHSELEPLKAAIETGKQQHASLTKQIEDAKVELKTVHSEIDAALARLRR